MREPRSGQAPKTERRIRRGAASKPKKNQLENPEYTGKQKADQLCERLERQVQFEVGLTETGGTQILGAKKNAVI